MQKKKTDEIEILKKKINDYTQAVYHTGSELYKMPDGSFINEHEYEIELDKLILQLKRAIRKKERGFKYVDTDNNRFD